jgi:hypothetical protein
MKDLAGDGTSPGEPPRGGYLPDDETYPGMKDLAGDGTSPGRHPWGGYLPEGGTCSEELPRKLDLAGNKNLAGDGTFLQFHEKSFL